METTRVINGCLVRLMQGWNKYPLLEERAKHILDIMTSVKHLGYREGDKDSPRVIQQMMPPINLVVIHYNMFHFTDMNRRIEKVGMWNANRQRIAEVVVNEDHVFFTGTLGNWSPPAGSTESEHFLSFLIVRPDRVNEELKGQSIALLPTTEVNPVDTTTTTDDITVDYNIHSLIHPEHNGHITPDDNSTAILQHLAKSRSYVDCRTQNEMTANSRLISQLPEGMTLLLRVDSETRRQWITLPAGNRCFVYEEKPGQPPVILAPPQDDLPATDPNNTFAIVFRCIKEVEVEVPRIGAADGTHREWIPQIDHFVQIRGDNNVYLIKDFDVYEKVFILAEADSVRMERRRRELGERGRSRGAGIQHMGEQPGSHVPKEEFGKEYIRVKADQLIPYILKY